MSAIVEIDESNGANETITHNISNSNMGSADIAGMNAIDYPITPGNNSFEKWQRFHVTSMGGSSKIDNLKVWRTGALGANCVHKTNARETSYAGAETYSTPSAVDRSLAYHYTEDMPTSEPAGANLGINGSLTGALTNTGYSDYLVHQLQTTISATTGASTTLNYSYDETA